MAQQRTAAESAAMAGGTVDESEIARFEALAGEWWRPDGPFRPLHALNIPRLTYVRDTLCRRHGREIADEKPLAGLEIVDIGCGGGLIAEPLARLGATMTGIDAGGDAIEAARVHAEQSGLEIDYRRVSAEALAAEGRQYDCVLALEVVEHVADLDAFLAAGAGLLRPGGSLFAATLNRTAASFLLAIIAAEYVLRWLPRGTHQWSKFVKPSELVAPLRRNGVAVRDVSGMRYDPIARDWSLGGGLAVNYILHGEKNES
jgi:2-polyprenyl-6-hydroxyphenyl methylase/3-demethylubiquinone-9 3-methyltransferase